MLKSTWLEGKRNRRVDQLINVLVTELLSDIEDRLERQDVGLHREDLAGRRELEIRNRAPETPRDYITRVADMHFQVRSSDKEIKYEVDLLNTECTCLDFPRIKFCKHLASVEHYFGEAKVAPGNPSSQPSPIAPALHKTDRRDAAYDENAAAASLISVTNEIIALSQELLMRTPKPEAVSNTVKSLHLVRSQLAAVIVSANGDGPQLPEKEQIAPNQHSWTETAERMGVKRKQKGRGKVDSARTAEHIGEINRKRNRGEEDPYGAGEQSGKRAKPDARSAAANTRARAVTVKPGPTPPRPPPASLPSRLPSPRAPGAVPMPYYLPGHPLPMSQPTPGLAPPLPSPLPPPAPLPAHPGFPFPHAPASLPQGPYYPPPFLSQPASFSLPQLTSYHPGFQMYYPGPYYPPTR